VLSSTSSISSNENDEELSPSFAAASESIAPTISSSTASSSLLNTFNYPTNQAYGYPYAFNYN
jgi:hypothetical protein